MATTEYGTRSGITTACLAALAFATHFAAEVTLGVLDVLFLEPLRWLIYPDVKIELELRGLDTVTAESLRLERDKPMSEFSHRADRHAEFIGGGFAPDSYRGGLAA